MAAEPPEIHYFFPTIVETVGLPDADSLNANLMTAIASLREQHKDQGSDPWSEFFTTYKSQNRLYELPAFRDLTRHIQREADLFARNLGLDPANPLYITGCWVNIYNEGHSQDLHVHTGQVVSGVYYVKTPPGVPGLAVYSPFAEAMLDAPVKEITPMNAKFLEIPAIAGEMLLFRSSMRHCVRPNRTKGERISIAFNLTI